MLYFVSRENTPGDFVLCICIFLCMNSFISRCNSAALAVGKRCDWTLRADELHSGRFLLWYCEVLWCFLAVLTRVPLCVEGIGGRIPAQDCVGNEAAGHPSFCPEITERALN